MNYVQLETMYNDSEIDEWLHHRPAMSQEDWEKYRDLGYAVFFAAFLNNPAHTAKGGDQNATQQAPLQTNA